MRAIDADTLENNIRECIEAKESNYEYDKATGLDIALECVAEALTIQPERRRGRWIFIGDGYKCSKCGSVYSWWADSQTSNYCPNCGAEMRGEAE